MNLKIIVLSKRSQKKKKYILYEYVKTYQIMLFKRLDFIVCLLYLKKAVKNKFQCVENLNMKYKRRNFKKSKGRII